MISPLSLTARMSLLFSVATACILFIAGYLFEVQFENKFWEDNMEELVDKTRFIGDEIRNITSPAGIAALPFRLHDMTAGHPGIVITLEARDGTVLYSVGRREIVKLLLADAKRNEDPPSSLTFDNHDYRVIANQFPLGMPNKQQVNVAIALEITNDQDFVTQFKERLWLGIFLAALSMGWLGWIAVRRGLRPIHDVSALMSTVSAQQLDKPLPMVGVPHELHELASAFNRMLVRLHDSFELLSDFSSDIAHELRTPINNMMVQTQVILSRDRDPVEYRTNLQSNLEELERLSRMVSDMLFLAKADISQVVPKREKIDLHEEMTRLFDFYEALASERQVQLVLSGDAGFFGDRLMIQRALSNLLSNAIRFTPNGMATIVNIGENEHQAIVSIENPGPEIPAEHLPRIFERFYRVDASRREGHTDNVGLGLAITKSIVEIHGGTISAGSENGRTHFTVMFPLQQGTY
jgi:two-component system, OmpR family, heavy metal sensor histidine kinase CusS